MLETLTPPAPDLVTMLEALEYLGIPVAEQDPALQSYISRASASITSHLGYNPNAGTYRETIQTGPAGAVGLLLSRLPVGAVSAVTLNGEALDATQYSVEAEAGLLVRVSAGLSRRWEPRSLVTVEYTAGFDPLPADLKAACLRLVEADWTQRGKDPSLKSISIGSIGLTYFGAAAAPGIASVEDLLRPFRMVRVG